MKKEKNTSVNKSQQEESEKKELEEAPASSESGPQEGETAQKSSSKTAADRRRLAVLIFVIVSAFLSLCCALLYLSTLPRAELAEQAGYYQLSQAETEGLSLEAEELELGMTLHLKANGWCELGLYGRRHIGRWSTGGDMVYIKCLGLKLSALASPQELRLENLMGKGIDVVLSKG